MGINQLFKNVKSSKKNRMLGLLALFLGISALVVGYFATRSDNRNEKLHTETKKEIDTLNTTTEHIEKDLDNHKVEVDTSLKNLKNKDEEITVEVSKIKEVYNSSSKEISEIKKEQQNNSNYIKDSKSTIEKISFDTASARFFQENDFSKYEKFFKYGFTVYHNSLEFEKPFKKSYGSNIYVEYVEYSDVEFIKPENGSSMYVLRLNQKFKKVAGGREFSENIFDYNVLVDFKNVAKVQKLYGIGEYGRPYYNFCDYFILLSYQEPFTYAIGPQDCDIFKNRGD